jgi:hypothetical protein
MNRFENLGIVKNEPLYNEEDLEKFTNTINSMQANKNWVKNEIVDLFNELIPNFNHKETGKYLDSKM